ncbi:pyridoxamine 5'-phosphate oxidase family protein [Sphaerisporangium perillae]|uniref:pyridoxamine 5'-phosphate oxidase family protein n=1 Tax=Sphaerisporangium perillae TaxID=2935860 RepID=UPI0020109EBC|nr:pyridoxamine 5'-phosphate oxidase family protein [Sphaerisporangium perillae]
MTLDSAGLQVLSREECLVLLASVPVGRIVFTDRALPAVQPVNFVLDGESIVIRTAAGSRLASAATNAVVAFEGDEFDAGMRSGWSVTMVGHARAVQDLAEIDRLSRLPLMPWVPDGREQFIVMYPEHISGRRIHDCAPPAAPACA